MTDLAQPNDSWSNVHDLALLFIALAYGTDSVLTDKEIEQVTAALNRWRPDDKLEVVREVVVEAIAILEADESGDEVIRSIEALKQKLEPASRRRALEDVMRIAEADGLLLSSERTLISVVASSWDLKAAEAELLAKSTALVDDRPVWTLLHDIAMLGIAVAHGSTGSVDPDELHSLILRLSGWRSDLEEEDIRAVIRTALISFAEGELIESLQQSAGSIRERLPHALRLIVLDDLIAVAEADGSMNATERDMIGSLAQAWQLGVRVDA